MVDVIYNLVLDKNESISEKKMSEWIHAILVGVKKLINSLCIKYKREDEYEWYFMLSLEIA